MLDLVLWSGSVALAPWALGLAWRLISSVARRIGPAAPTESVQLPRVRRAGSLRRPVATRD